MLRQAIGEVLQRAAGGRRAFDAHVPSLVLYGFQHDAAGHAVSQREKFRLPVRRFLFQIFHHLQELRLFARPLLLCCQLLLHRRQRPISFHRQIHLMGLPEEIAAGKKEINESKRADSLGDAKPAVLLTQERAGHGERKVRPRLGERQRQQRGATIERRLRQLHQFHFPFAQRQRPDFLSHIVLPRRHVLLRGFRKWQQKKREWFLPLVCDVLQETRRLPRVSQRQVAQLRLLFRHEKKNATAFTYI